MKHTQLIKDMLDDTLVFDIETSSEKDGLPIDLQEDFDLYVEFAIAKWVGVYSYREKKHYLLNAITQRDFIIDLFSKYKYVAGFNSLDFDKAIMVNNGLIKNKYMKNLDMRLILGNSNYEKGFKDRASYMGVEPKPCVVNGKKFGANSLQGMAHAFGFDLQKGDIDYKIFYNNSWTEEETKEIKKYLHADVKLTKMLFDRTVKFWSLFTDWLNEKDVKNWSWINTTIASLTYISACKVKNTEATFSNAHRPREKMGGRAVDPPYEETTDAHYLDEVSKYPHLFSEFNLFSEIDVSGMPKEKLDKYIKQGLIFHGNEKFKVKGYYDIRKHGVLEIDIINKLKTRFAIKSVLKTYYKYGKTIIPKILEHLIPDGVLTKEILKQLKGLEYAIKIYANALYGAVRSSSFEKISSPNAGYDCCWIGQQIHKYIQDGLEAKGLEIVGGFTDSWFVKDKGMSKDEIIKYANEMLESLKKYMPFPEETHTIGYECFIDYVVYHYNEKEKRYMKNNYALISDGKIKIVGFPIMKSNACKLAIHIFDKYLREDGLKKKRLKWNKSYIMNLVQKELKDDIMLAAVNYRCNRADAYKNPSQLQAQISRAYFKGRKGRIDVIKNTKYGKAGKGEKYCNVEEMKKYNITFNDLILDKFWNEIAPFILKEKPIDLSNWGL